VSEDKSLLSSAGPILTLCTPHRRGVSEYSPFDRARNSTIAPMPSFTRYVVALFAWETCVIGSVFATVLFLGGHIGWSKDDLAWIAELIVCGLVVVGAVAWLSGRFGKIGAAAMGVLFGLLPSMLILAWVFVARPGFEESAGSGGFAMLLAGPSGVGGALAGIICSGKKKTS